MRYVLAIACCAVAAAGCGPTAPYQPSDQDIAEVTSAATSYVADHVDALLGVHDTTWSVDWGRTQAVGDPPPDQELELLVGMWPDSLGSLMRQFYDGDIPSYPVNLPERVDVISADSLRVSLPRSPENQPQFVHLARPAFAPSGRRAVVAFDLSCSWSHKVLCGHNDLVYLERRDSTWVVSEVVRRHVS